MILFKFSLFCSIFGFCFSAAILNDVKNAGKTLKNQTAPVCKDGKGPLLEGDDSIPFPCLDECPDGFECEFSDNQATLGICCPNLELLYQLYGTSDENAPAMDLPSVEAKKVDPTTSGIVSTVSTTAKTTSLPETTSKAATTLSTTPPTSKITAQPSTSPTTVSTTPIPSSKATVHLSTRLSTVLSSKPAKIPPSSQSPDRELLKLVQNKEEVRLSKDSLPTHRLVDIPESGYDPEIPVANPSTSAAKPLISSTNPSTTTSTTAAKPKFETLITKNVEEKSTVKAQSTSPTTDVSTLPPTASSTVTATSSSTLSTTATEPNETTRLHTQPPFDAEFSCKRQKFETKCDGGRRNTQIVIRWFVKNGMCCAYPYGFCPGDTIKDDRTMRTKEDCEKFCTGKTASQEAGAELEEVDGKGNTIGQGFLKPESQIGTGTGFEQDGSVAHVLSENGISAAAEPSEYPPLPKSRNPMNPLDEPDSPPTLNPAFPTLAGPVQGEVDAHYELEEVFPPGYGPEIDEDNKTRVILHSDALDPIPIPPPDENSHQEARKLVQEPVANVQNDQTETGNETLAKNVENDKTFTEKMSGMKILKRPASEVKKSSLPPKNNPKKSCQKSHPFRAMCRSGMPSQFTLRWYVKAGMCCSYPYGYCHGESVFEEESIKTKEECEEFCLGKVDSEVPFRRRLLSVF